MEIPKLISDKLVVILNKQIQNELNNSRFYRAVGEWCDYNGFYASAKLFKSYEPEEKSHHDKIIQFLQDRNVLPILPSSPEQPRDFKDLPSIYELGLQHEIQTTKDWSAIADLAVSEKDHMVYQLSLEFIKEQVEEESHYITYLDKIEKCGTDKLGIQFFEQWLGEEIKED